MSNPQSQPAVLPLAEADKKVPAGKTPALKPAAAASTGMKTTRRPTELDALKMKLTQANRSNQAMAKASAVIAMAASTLAAAVLDIEDGEITPWDPHSIQHAIECAETTRKMLKDHNLWKPDSDDDSD